MIPPTMRTITSQLYDATLGPIIGFGVASLLGKFD